MAAKKKKAGSKTIKVKGSSLYQPNTFKKASGGAKKTGGASKMHSKASSLKGGGRYGGVM